MNIDCIPGILRRSEKIQRFRLANAMGDRSIMRLESNLIFSLLVLLALVGAAAPAHASSDRGGRPGASDLTFTGSRAEAERYIGHHHSIQLTPEQETIRREALEAMAAPCCSKFSAATCCCECNLARTIWGLSKFLIVEKGASAEQVRGAVGAWVQAINPAGYTGDSCFTGGCGRPFRQGGCGGMKADRLIF